MPIISATRIQRTRRIRYCEACQGQIRFGESVVRLYGMAHHGDHPYRVFVCPECAEKSLDVSEALNRKPRAKTA